MNKFFAVFFAVGLLAGTSPAAFAAPVPGFEALYDATFVACTLPSGSVKACEVAIDAYSSQLITAVDISEANASFSELRLEVFAANSANEEFQAEIDALFELLLPDSGAIAAPSPAA